MYSGLPELNILANAQMSSLSFIHYIVAFFQKTLYNFLVR